MKRAARPPSPVYESTGPLFHRTTWLQPGESRSARIVALLLSLFLPAILCAQEKSIVAVPVTDVRLHIDGRLDDPIWRTTPFISDFLVKDPVEFGEPSSPTRVAFAYDDHNLYVAAEMRFSSRDELQAMVTRRDKSGPSDRIIVSLDTWGDRRTAWSFSVTAAGVRTEYFHGSDSEYDRDYSFDPVWEAKTWIGDDRWTAEMRIPFSQLRFNDAEEQIWGLNINRYMPGTREDIYWIVVPRNGTGWSSQMGELRGITGLSPSPHVELLPYLAGSARIADNVDPDDPYRDEIDLDGRAGLDFKLVGTSNLTLTATINPDFGQVEADPAEVNLSAFETFFSERRPFFVEGSGNFNFGGATHYYSRRIGGQPHATPQGVADYADRPDNSTILGAAKLTGRLASGLSIGTLAAVTDREQARLWNIERGEETTEVVEPLTFYGVSRMQQEFGGEGTVAGVILTGVNRSIEPGSYLASILPDQAYTGGVDWSIRFGDGTYSLIGNVAGSHVSGESEAITRIQRSSTHYFQRPDATHLELDSNATGLSGYSGAVEFRRNTGSWVYNAGAAIESAGFELNDLGRLSSADDIDAWGALTYRQNRPGSFYQNWDVTLDANRNWNTGGEHQYSAVNLNGSITWPSLLFNYLGAGRTFEGLSDAKTRGGPTMDETDLLLNIWTGMGNNGGAKTRWYWHAGWGAYEYSGAFLNTYAGITSNIGSRLELSANPTFYTRSDPRQYVATVGGGEADTYGRRYIFSKLDFTRLSLQLRANYALSPDLTLEFYAEPFVASGTYSRFGELARAGTGELDEYGDRLTRSEGSLRVNDNGSEFTINDPDFTTRSFRSNLVLRWEYLPGSTLFLVWQQSRGEYRPTAEAISPGDWFEGLGDEGEHVVAVKMNWLVMW